MTATTPPPVRFGLMQQAPFVQTAPTYQTNVYKLSHQVLGSAPLIRLDFRWNPVQTKEPDWAMWDKILVRAESNKMRVMLCVHAEGMIAPGTDNLPWTDWENVLRKAVTRYGSYVKQWEVSNEPNRAQSIEGGWTPGLAANIIGESADIIHQEAAKYGFKAYVWGPVIGTADVDYLRKMTDGHARFLTHLDGVSVHMYAREDPSAAPSIATESDRHRIRSLWYVRYWMDNHYGKNLPIAITEGGYSGQDTIRCNSVSLDNQALYTQEMVPWLQRYNVTIFLQSGFVREPPVSTSAPCKEYYWNGMGIAHLNGTLLPAGQVVQKLNEGS